MDHSHFGPVCQSCAMPMNKPEDFGTEADATPSREYCTYCYQNGSFVNPDMTMEQMRDFCIEKMDEMNIMPHDQAAAMMNEVIPGLKRWNPPKP